MLNSDNNTMGNKSITNKQDVIFKFLDPNENNKLSLMSGLDLQDLLVLLDDYYLELRTSLGFDKSVTFGLELEFEKAMKKRLCSKFEKRLNGDWAYYYRRYNRSEIKSPILQDEDKTWADLRKVCEIVNSNAKLGRHSSLVINVGAHIMGSNKKTWLNFIKLWAVYENIIFRFAYGEYLTTNYYVPRISSNLCDIVKNLENKSYNIEQILEEVNDIWDTPFDLINVRDYTNYQERNKIEIKCLNGTFEAAILQNNINFFVNFLTYCKSSNFDNYIVEKRHNINLDNFSSLELYNQVYLQQALELCDMIFTNNLDKIYFLRQYLKSFEIGSKTCEKAKRFVVKK